MAARALAADQPEGNEKLLSIGQVLTRLSEDFPDLAPSKLRYLEEQGLVHPRRTKSGYRKFTQNDVERLRFVLSVQRDHYLPLRVIRQYLDELEEGGSPVLPGLIAAANGNGAARVPTFYSRQALQSVTGATSQQITQAVSAGLLPAGDRYDASAVELLGAIVQLSKYGIEPRHLSGVRASVDREIGLVESAVGPLLSKQSAQSQAKAQRQAVELTEQIAVIRKVLYGQGLARLQP